MPAQLSIVELRWLRLLTAALGLCTFIAGLVSFSGWVFDIPHFTDWLNDGISTQPNTAVLIALSGAAVVLLQFGYFRVAMAVGGFIALGGALNLLQYITDADFGINHQLLFGREWGYAATMAPGRIGPPASLSLLVIGTSLVLLSTRNEAAHRLVPRLALFIALLMMFSLLGYLFGARDFYAIPWLSAIALPSASMLMTLAVSLVISVPQHHPMLLLCERSGAGAMARTVLPLVIVMIPLFIWLRIRGYELGLFDIGTSRALGAATLILGVVALMWNALLALRRREQRERETDRRKDEFLAILAHELRNPLAPISNATSMLKLAHNNREISERATNMIERQLAHLVRLIDDLLDLSRISRGKLELRRERVELSTVIHQAIETCSPLAESASQKITLQLPSEPIYMDADPVRLTQVVSNLLNNACKFAGQRGHISLSVSRKDMDVIIAVKDDGIGIPPEMLGFIFEMFSQVDQSLERSQNGLGIGLTLGKRLVELHGGNIQALSEGLGKGSEFVVRLPVALDQTPPQEIAKSVYGTSSSNRVLIVDDNVSAAESLAEVLRLTGNETFLAHDGEEAVNAAEIHRPNVILLDIGMPRLNGFDACRRIRENSWAETILIIALTGWGQEEDRRKSAEAGFDGHLVKPVDITKLLNLLSNLPSRQDAAGKFQIK